MIAERSGATLKGSHSEVGLPTRSHVQPWEITKSTAASKLAVAEGNELVQMDCQRFCGRYRRIQGLLIFSEKTAPAYA